MENEMENEKMNLEFFIKKGGRGIAMLAGAAIGTAIFYGRDFLANLNQSVWSVWLPLFGVVLVQVVLYRKNKKDREIKFLEGQFRELYAPLFYLIKQNEQLFSLNREFRDASHSEYIDKEWSKNEYTQEVLASEAAITIELRNQYIRQVHANNQYISELLDSKFSYIDSDDIDLFLDFSRHRVRFLTEIPDGRVMITPARMASYLEKISHLPTDFMDAVTSKFERKKLRLDELIK